MKEGYLLIDHRATGIGPNNTSKFIECATVTCSHCQRIIILNPERRRNRNYCPKCNHYICDTCESIRVISGYACRPFSAVIDSILAHIN